MNKNNQTKPYTDLLTIAMPVFERKEFFAEALGSALNQTVKCKIIVVDNCSSNNYFKETCEKNNVTYYRNESNIGLYPNIRKCYSLTKTKYVMTLDDDDILSPVYVESFLNAVEKYPEIDVFYSDFALITSNGEEAHQHILPFGYFKSGKEIIEFGVKYKLGFPFMSSVLKKENMKDFGNLDTSYGSYDWLWIYSKADKFSFFGCPEKLYKYRQHDNQDTKNNSTLFMLTMPYLYGKILNEKVTDKKLKKKASINAFWSFVLLKSSVNGKELKQYKNGNSEYEKYLNAKLKDSVLLGMIFKFPRLFVSFIFKSLRKLNFVD
jgi:glycosyltransferase involved in cell wall biosynthesis